MRRYNAENIVAMVEAEDGAFVLFNDAQKALIEFLAFAVESGADKDKLIGFMESRNETKN